MNRLVKNRHMLYVLKNSNNRIRKYLLKHADCEVIKTIAEIAYNTLIGNNKIHGKTKRLLHKYKKELRALACLNKKVTFKRKIIVQKGGFLPILLGTVLSGVISSIIENYGKQKEIN